MIWGMSQCEWLTFEESNFRPLSICFTALKKVEITCIAILTSHRRCTLSTHRRVISYDHALLCVLRPNHPVAHEDSLVFWQGEVKGPQLTVLPERVTFRRHWWLEDTTIGGRKFFLALIRGTGLYLIDDGGFLLLRFSQVHHFHALTCMGVRRLLDEPATPGGVRTKATFPDGGQNLLKFQQRLGSCITAISVEHLQPSNMVC